MYEYYTLPGNGQTLVQIFNAVAMICGNADFTGLLQLASLLGFMVLLIVAVYKVDLKDSFVYIFIIMGIWMGLMLPKSEVVIIESSGHNMTPIAYRVDNVPFGLAVSASIISKIGSWMTTESEQVFSLPNDLNYSETGVLFANRLYRQVYSTNLTDPKLQNDWAAFMHQCSFFDINMYHYYSLEELLSSTDILTTLGKTNQVLYTSVSKGSNVPGDTAMTCIQAYNLLSTRTQNNLNNQVIPRKAQEMMGELGWRQHVGPSANTIYLSMGDAALQYAFGNISVDARMSIQQAAMANMVKNAEMRNASAMQDDKKLAIALSTAQAERQWVMSQLTGSSQASSFLPVMRATLEGIMIGIFPFIVVIALLAGVMAFKTIMFYIMSLFWLQLWAPIAAIMNLIMTSHSASNIYSQLHGLDVQTLQSSFGILQAAVEGEAMAGYAFWLVPMLSFALVMGGRGMANSMIGMISSGQSVGNATGSQMGTGNINMGNTSYNNATGNKSSMDAVYTDTGVGRVNSSAGTYSWTNGQVGSMRAQAAKHDLPVSGSSTIKASDMYSQQASQSIQAGQQQEAVASAATTLANSQALSYLSQVGRDSSAGKEISSRMSTEQRQAVDEMMKAASKIDDQFKIGQSSQTLSALAVGLGVNGGAGANMEVLKLGLAGKVNSEGKAVNTDEYARAVSAATTALRERGVSLDQGLASAIASSDSFRNSLSQGDSLAQSTQASLSQAQTATQSAKTHFSQAESYQQDARKAAESNATISVDNSAAAGDAWLHEGRQTLSSAYQKPANKAAIEGAAQQGLESKGTLEQATSGTAFSPAHSLQATDRPVNEVGAANARNQSHVNAGAGAAFGHVEQQAGNAGLSGSDVKQRIGQQQTALNQRNQQKTGEVQQAISSTSGTVEGDAANLQKSFTDMDKSTSIFQSTNSSILSQSDGSDGSGYNMVREVGVPAVKDQSLTAPGGQGSSEGFTDSQARIQQDNSKPFEQLGRKLGLTSDSINYQVKPKGDKQDPKL